MRRMYLAFISGAAAFSLLVGGAHAQSTDPTSSAAPATASTPAPKPVKAKAPDKSASKAVKKLPFVTITVKNSRTVGLTSLTAVMSATAGDPVKIAGPLAPAKTAKAHVAHDKDCMFDLHGEFADGATTDLAGVNLCKEKTLNLVE